MADRRIPQQKINTSIPQPKKFIDDYIRFTFKYVIEPKEFIYHGSSLKICEFIDRLKHHTSQKRLQFIADYSETTRNQPVDIEKIKERMDLNKLPDIETDKIYQFSMGSSGRIFGFFIDDLFVCRLVDTNHEGYKKKK